MVYPNIVDVYTSCENENTSKNETKTKSYWKSNHAKYQNFS